MQKQTWPGTFGTSHVRGFKPATLALALATAFSVHPLTTQAQANPTGGVAIHGQAAISTPAPNQLRVVTQNGAGTSHSAINWQSFSITAGSSTTIVQPGATSLSINRVVTNTPSNIFGTLSSNGRLVLVNQSGIAVGAGAVIDTAGFTASTLRMSDADALAGRLRFGDATASMGGAAGLTVGGRITARDGDVVLIAPSIDIGTSALVQAPNGSTLLAAGQQVEITGRGLEGITLLVQAPADQVRNLGRLEGNAVGIFAGTLRHSGEIWATTATLDGGTVLLKATGDAYVEGTGKVLATGVTGGRVDVLGNRVAVMDQATVDVSGTQGGGNIRVGGDFQGKNPDVANAQRTYLGPDATLRSDAIGNGDGGRVIVWADNQTKAFGTISARGGAQGGNGGFVEVSGKQKLEFQAAVNTLAPKGSMGTLLLDPQNIAVQIGGTAPITSVDQFADSPGASLIVSPATLNAVGGNVVLQATRDIDFVDPVGLTTPNASLTAQAGGIITVLTPITTNGGNITLYANPPGSSGPGPSGSAVYVQAALNSNGGNIVLRSDATNSGNGIVIAADITTGAGNLTLITASANGKIDQTAGAIVAVGTTVVDAGTGNVSLNRATNNFSSIGITGGAAVVRDIDALQLNATNVGSLSVISNGGGITQSAPVIVSGATSIIATGGNVTLITPGNNFNTLSVSGGAINVAEGAGSLLTVGSVNAGSGVVLTADLMSITGAVTSPGTVTLRPVGLARNIHIEASPTAGVLSLTPGDLQQVTSSVLDVGRLDGTGDVFINQNINDPNINAGTLRFLAGNNFSNGNLSGIGAAAGSFNLQLRANNHVTLQNSNVNLGDNRSLTIVADNDNSGAGNVSIGPILLHAGAGAGNATGNMSISGRDITIAVSGNLSGLVKVFGTGTQSISATNNLTLSNTNTVSGDLTVRTDGGAQTVSAGGNLSLSAGAGTQTFTVLHSEGDQSVTAAAIVGNGGASGFGNSIFIEGQRNQNVTVGAGGIQLSGGGGALTTDSNNKAAIYHYPTAGTNQTVTVNGGGSIMLQGGSSAKNATGSFQGSYSYIGSEGGTQTISFSSGGNLSLTGGTVGSRNYANVFSTGPAQSITGASSISVTGGASGGTATDGNFGLINSGTGTQTISAGSIVVQGGGGGTLNYAKISSGNTQGLTATSIALAGGAAGGGLGTGNSAEVLTTGNQNVTVGSGGLSLTGGGGVSDNVAHINQLGTSGTSQNITVNAGGSIVMQGGPSSGSNLGGFPHSSAVTIKANGDSQQINFSSGGEIQLTGGSIGSNNFASIHAANGTQSIAGPSAIRMTGGASGGFVSEGNVAAIIANVGAQTIVAGDIVMHGGDAGIESWAWINAAGLQTINASAITMVGGGNGGGNNDRAAIETSGSQAITVGAGGLHLTGGGGVLTGHSAEIKQKGTTSTSQTITVNGGGSIVLQGGSSAQAGLLNGGSYASINSFGDTQTVDFTNGGAISITGGTVGSSAYAEIFAKNGAQTVGGAVAPSITLTGGASGGSAGVNDDSNHASIGSDLGSQSIIASGIVLQGGAAGNQNLAAVYSKLSQNIAVGSAGLHLSGGGGSATDRLNFAGVFQGDQGTAVVPGTSQTITVGGGGSITLQGGSSAGTNVGVEATVNLPNLGRGSFASIIGDGNAQLIQFSAAGGGISATGGTVGSRNVATIEARFGTQTIQGTTGANAPTISLTGGASGGIAGEGNSARISTSFSAQTISAGSIVVQGGSGGAENFSKILSGGNQTISATGLVVAAGAAGGGTNTGNSAFVLANNASQSITLGSGGLSITGGGGALTDNGAFVQQSGVAGTSQFISINGGGSLVIQGGSSARTNVGGAGHGSRALIQSDGDSQQITLNGGGVISLTGGTNGSRNYARIIANTGSQSITGASSITLTGGASGGFDLEGNGAEIFANAGTQTITAGAILLQGGASGIENRAQFDTVGNQTISASGITLIGGTDGGGFNDGNRARISTGASQALTVGAGGIHLTGGGGSLSDNAALIEQLGTGGTQTVNISNGAIVMLGGSSAGTNVGGTGHGSRASIYSEGPAQTINFSGTGSISLTGGTVGSRNFAQIYAQNTGVQTITGAPSVTLTGGASGGVAGEGNSASISTNSGSQNHSFSTLNLTGGLSGNENSAGLSVGGATGTQTISATGSVALQGSAGGIGNSAYLTGPIQIITLGGNLDLTGSSNGDTNSGARIGGRANSNTNLNLGVTGNLTLTAGNGSGAAVGASASAVGFDSTVVVVTGGDVVLNPSATQGARIGHNTAAPQTGSVSVTAGGDITLNSGGGTGIAGIRSLGNVTLAANNTGHGIAQSLDSAIVADKLALSADAGITLDSPANQVNSLTAFNLGSGAIRFTNEPGRLLTLTGALNGNAISQAGMGDVVITADDIDINRPVSAPLSVVILRPLTLARDIHIEGSPSAGVLSLSPADLQQVSSSVLEVGRLDGAGNLNLTASIADTNINAGTLRLKTGNNLNSSAGASIGSAGSPFNHNLELYASNDVTLTNGDIRVANDRFLAVIADNDNSSAGDVNIGAVTLEVGVNSGNTLGNMVLSGHNITVATSGGGSALVRVIGDGTLTLTAANNITFANNNTTSGSVQVGTGTGLQTITAGGQIAISAGTGSGTYTQVYATGDQLVSASGMTLAGGATGSGNDVTLVSFSGSQTIALDSAGLHVTGGGGAGTDNAAQIYQFGTTGKSQVIALTGGGSVVLQGGSSAGSNVGAGSGSFAVIDASGDSQQLTFAGGGQLQITGGSTGSNNYAQVWSSNGTQNVSGPSTITLQGGASGGVSGEGNFATLGSGVGAQSVSAGNILVQGGASGIANYATIYGAGGQTIGAAGITAVGGLGGGGSSNDGNSAQLSSNGSQSISVGSGGLHLTGGAGSAGGDNFAALFQGGTVGASQTITVNGGGAFTLLGGSSTTLGVGAGPGSGVNVHANGDLQQVTFSAGGVLQITGGTNGSKNFAQIYAVNGAQSVGGATSITLTGGASGGIDTEGNFANISAGSGTQTVTAGSILLQGGPGGAENYANMSSATGQTIHATGITLLAGAGGGGLNTGNNASIGSNASQAITVAAGGLHLTGGGGTLQDNSAIVRQGGATGTSQTITVNSGGLITLQGGSASATSVGGGHGAFAVVTANGDQQQINFTAGGSVQIDGGTSGSNNIADIFSGNGTQTITGATAVTLTGGASGGVAGEGNIARIFANVGAQSISTGTILVQGGASGLENRAVINANGTAGQSINATGMTLLGGAAGSANLANVITNGQQNVTIGTGGLTLTGGGGPLSDNSAQLYAAAGPGQTILVNNGGAITMQGGSSALTNVGGSGHGSRAFIESDGAAQSITFSAGGNLSLTGGTNGSRAFAQIYALTGPQTVSGATAITLTGGASGGFAGEGNRVGIIAAGGTQTISAGSIALQGGAAGIENRANIDASVGDQVISANSISIQGGASGTESRAGISATLGSQDITVGGGGLSLTGGGGSSSDRKNYANVFQGGLAGKHQTVTVGGGGNITIQGGSSAGTNVGLDNGSFAFITSDGDAQLVEFSGPGSVINVTGGSVGSLNYAGLSARNGTQTIRGTTLANGPTISLTGGASGGVAGENNSGGLFAGAGLQSISAGALTMQGGAAGIGNSAYITAPTQTLAFSGNLSLTGGAAGDSSGGARIGGNGGTATPSNTNLTLDVGGSLTLSAGASSGTAVGASGNAVGLNSVVVLNAAGNVVLNPSATQGVRIGHSSAAPQTGSVTVTAGGNISLNSGGGTGVAGILSLGNVTLSAANAGKSITEAADSAIVANQLGVTGNAGVSLGGSNNLVSTLDASSASGNISFNNGQSLTVANLSTGAGAQAVSISTIGGSSSLTLGASTSDDNLSLVSGGATNLTGALSANSISVTSGAALTLSQNLTTTGALSLITPDSSAITQLAGTIVSGGQTSINAGTGDVTLTSAGNDFTQISATGGIVRVRDVNAVALGPVHVQGLALQTGGSITLGGPITATGTGDAVALAATAGTLDALAGSITTPNGRWLVYLAAPGGHNFGPLQPDFKQFGATLGSTVLGTTGNGLLYGNAPTLSASLTGLVSKTYDGSTVATLTGANYSVVGIDSDVLTLNNPGLGSYDTKDAGVGKTVTVNGVNVAGAVDINGKPVFGYPTSVGTLTGVIGTVNKATLTASVAAPNKTYDGSTSATPTLTITSGLVGSETLLPSALANFNSKDVSTANLVTVNSATLADGTNGGLASNYSLATGQTAAANITPKALTASATANNKGYDGSTSATALLGGFAGLIGLETVTGTGTGTFNTKDVLTANLVTVNIASLANGTNGGLASNYTLAPGQTAAASITPKTLTASYLGTDRKYNGLLSADVTSTTVGLVPGDVVNFSQNAEFVSVAPGDGKDVGVGKAINVSSISLAGGDASNYALSSTTVTTSATIARRALSTWTGSAGDNKWSSASNWDAIPDGANVAAVVIDVGAGPVTMDSPDVNLQSLSSTRPLTQSTGSFQTPQLSVSTIGGMTLANNANKISELTASNQGSGDIVIRNAAPLVIAGMANGAGNIGLINTGAIVTTGLVSASGTVALTANSPLTIGVPGVLAGGNVTLIASNLTSAGNLTLDGPVTSSTGMVTLNAGNNLVQNSAVSAATGVAASAGATVSFGPFATANYAPISYSANGVAVTPPPTELLSGTAAAQTDVLVTFLDLFEAAVEKQNNREPTGTNPDGSKKKKNTGDTVVTEGEICR